MMKIVLALAAVLLVGCQWGNLGFYVYPQAASNGVSEEPGPVAGMEVVGYLLSSRFSISFVRLSGLVVDA